MRIARFRTEIDAAIARVIATGTYILGEEVERFEHEFAAFVQARHCVGVGSGTDALALALRALGIGVGQEVIVPALTFTATAQAVLHCGATPCFADVDPSTRCMDPASVEAAITPKTAAIVPVHLFGEPCAMPHLVAIAKRHNLAIVEDCAQSHGASQDERPLGSFGDAAAYSFYPTKNLGCVGDGGAVTASCPALAARLRSLRNYGFEDSVRVSKMYGVNSRLDEIQAAILRVLLPHLGAANVERRAIAEAYRHGLADCPGIGLPSNNPGSVYHQFAITHPRRDDIADALRAAGIGSAIHYTPSLHRHPAFAAGVLPHLPVSERLAATLLSLPIQPEVASGVVDRVVRALHRQSIAA